MKLAIILVCCFVLLFTRGDDNTTSVDNTTNSAPSSTNLPRPPLSDIMWGRGIQMPELTDEQREQQRQTLEKLAKIRQERIDNGTFGGYAFAPMGMNRADLQQRPAAGEYFTPPTDTPEMAAARSQFQDQINNMNQIPLTPRVDSPGTNGGGRNLAAMRHGPPPPHLLDKQFRADMIKSLKMQRPELMEAENKNN